MKKITKEMKIWKDSFGKEYTDRNCVNLEDVESSYKTRYGKDVTPINLKNEFIGGLNKSIKILEVGSNIGNQLLWLQKMGFENLYGIELQSYAIELSKQRTKNINIIKGNAFDVPFKDDFFDLVFTDGVLIHINPKDINKILKEIYRCSNKYIWGFEYYADEYTEILYRNQNNLMWKANFPKLYTDLFPSLQLIKEKYLKYLDSDNKDIMYLFKKGI